METLEIKIKGSTPFLTNWQDQRKAINFKEGPGLYVLKENDIIVGLADAKNLHKETEEQESWYEVSYLLFSADIVVDLATKKAENTLLSQIEAYCKEINSYVYQAQEILLNAIDGIDTNIKESGGGQSISEITLLKALEIVTKKGE